MTMLDADLEICSCQQEQQEQQPQHRTLEHDNKEDNHTMKRATTNNTGDVAVLESSTTEAMSAAPTSTSSSTTTLSETSSHQQVNYSRQGETILSSSSPASSSTSLISSSALITTTSATTSIPLRPSSQSPLAPLQSIWNVFEKRHHDYSSVPTSSSSSLLPSSVSNTTIIEHQSPPPHGTIEKESKMNDCKGKKKKKNKWCSLLFGQFIALIATCQNASSFTLQFGLHVKFPMFLMFNVYIVLAVINLLPKIIHTTTTSSSEEEEESSNNYSSHNDAGPPPNSTTTIRRTATSTTTTTTRSCRSGSNKSPYCYTMPIFAQIKLLVPWYNYMFLSILDVLPNWMTLLALQYTSLTSTTLLGSLTVPAAMIVCKVLLHKNYQRHHYLGVIICMIGATLTIFSDETTTTTTTTSIANVSDGEGATAATAAAAAGTNTISSSSFSSLSHPQSHLGDLFAIIAALLYGAQDAVGEYWLKHVGDRQEYLGMLGFFGTMYTLILFPIMDGRQVLDFIHTLIMAISSLTSPSPDNDVDNRHISLVAVIPTVMTMLWFVSSVVIFYIATAYFLTWNDATLLILSLQACNIWAILYSIVAYHDTPSTLFYVAMSLVIGGVFLYEMLDSSSSSSSPASPSAPATVRTSKSLNDDRDAHQENETSKLLKRADSDSTTDDSSKSSSSSSGGGDVASSEDDSYHGYDCWYYGSTATSELPDIENLQGRDDN